MVVISPDREHPASRGYICQKAGRLNHYQNHNQRLDSPLRRRPDGTFEKIDWDTAVREIAARLVEIRDTHGGHTLAYYGGGGQGNHLQGLHGASLRKAMGTRYLYSALAQEKTGDFWVAGKIFGKQEAHLTPDQLEHADLAVFWGTNPWMAHGFPQARKVLKAIHGDPNRRMVVIDPKRTKTAQMADIHLAVRPGRDAFLLGALLKILSEDGGVDAPFIEKWTIGWNEVRAALDSIDAKTYCEHAGVALDDLRLLAKWIKETDKTTFRHDLGLEQSPHSTLNCYLEKLMIVVTGSFGREGTNTFHDALVPLINHSEPAKNGEYTFATKVTGMMPIGGLYPPNILPAEIDTDHPERIRGLFVDSANPLNSAADAHALSRAAGKLDLMVTIDVAMTETARHSHYVLPAASQYEKYESTFFNFGFPANHYHLRAPLFEPLPGTLTECEIYERIVTAMGEKPMRPLDEKKFPDLDRPARLALGPLYMMTRRFASANEKAVRAAGHAEGEHATLGDALFAAILAGPVTTTVREYAENFGPRWLSHEDGKFHLAVEPMLAEFRALEAERLSAQAEGEGEYPMVLMAGERRSFSANTIFRDPSWRKSDVEGTLHIHPEDAERYGLQDGARARCRSAHGELEVLVEYHDGCRRGTCTLPNGYGLMYSAEGEGAEREHGPFVNLLTGADSCDTLAKTPFHKYVPVALTAA